MISRIQKVVAVFWLTTLFLSTLAFGQRGQSDPPEGYQQVLPRGRIAAIFDPQYVPANRARIRPDAWVLGVVIDGEARAYSLTLLNSHEVVNDRIGETSFAAVW